MTLTQAKIAYCEGFVEGERLFKCAQESGVRAPFWAAMEALESLDDGPRLQGAIRGAHGCMTPSKWGARVRHQNQLRS